MYKTMKTDKWYLKIIIIFYRIVMPLIFIFLLLIAPQIGLLEKQEIGNTIFMRLITCIIFCLAYFNIPFISKGSWYFKDFSFAKTNLAVYPKSLLLSVIMIFFRFIVFYAFSEFTFEFFDPIFGNFNFLASGINSLLLTIPAIAQYFSSKENNGKP